jgi:hypothetical protein
MNISPNTRGIKCLRYAAYICTEMIPLIGGTIGNARNKSIELRKLDNNVPYFLPHKTIHVIRRIL